MVNYFEDNKPMLDNHNMVEPDKRIEQIVSTNGFEDSDSEAMLNNDEEIELDETISENIKLEHSSDEQRKLLSSTLQKLVNCQPDVYLVSSEGHKVYTQR